MDNNTDELSQLFSTNIVEYIGFREEKYPCSVNKCLNELEQLDNDEIKKQGCIYLLKILENILLDPQNLKTRRIRESNATFNKYVSKNRLFLNVLKSLGFCNISGFIVLQVVDMPRLSYTYKCIVRILSSDFNLTYKSLESHFFDPFKAYKHSSNIYKNTDPDVFEIKDKDETGILLNKTMKMLSECVMDTKLSDWNPRISIKVTTKALPLKNQDDNATDHHSIGSLIKLYNIEKSNDFVSKSKIKLGVLQQQSELLSEIPVVEIKLRFPKFTTLSLNLPPKTPVLYMRKQIQEILIDDVQLEDWHLVELPIKRRIDDNKTLLQQDIMCKVVLHFCYTGTKSLEQVIKSEYLEKFESRE